MLRRHMATKKKDMAEDIEGDTPVADDDEGLEDDDLDVDLDDDALDDLEVDDPLADDDDDVVVVR